MFVNPATPDNEVFIVNKQEYMFPAYTLVFSCYQSLEKTLFYSRQNLQFVIEWYSYQTYAI